MHNPARVYKLPLLQCTHRIIHESIEKSEGKTSVDTSLNHWLTTGRLYIPVDVSLSKQLRHEYCSHRPTPNELFLDRRLDCIPNKKISFIQANQKIQNL